MGSADGAWSLPPVENAGASTLPLVMWCPLVERLQPLTWNSNRQGSTAEDSHLQEQGCPTPPLSALSPQLPTTTAVAPGLLVA